MLKNILSVLVLLFMSSAVFAATIDDDAEDQKPECKYIMAKENRIAGKSVVEHASKPVVEHASWCNLRKENRETGTDSNKDKPVESVNIEIGKNDEQKPAENVNIEISKNDEQKDDRSYCNCDHDGDAQVQSK